MRRLGGLLAIAVTLGGCGAGDSASRTRPSPPPSGPSTTPPPTSIHFTEGTFQAGITFLHRNGATGKKYMPETMGGGVCLLDYDGDGWIDLYFVQSGAQLPDPARAGLGGSVLYHNRGDRTFDDVTAKAGLGGSGYGMGCTAADIDNDGDPDLYVTAYGRNHLYRNEGDGTFRDVTDQAGVGAGGWSTSAAFGDYDADGRPDLYVARYVDFRLDYNLPCGERNPGYTYCHPDNFPAVPDVLYHNEGGGRFRDATAAARIDDATGKGLGVVWGDFDNDGRDDIYVANDSTPNFLYHNRGDGTFEEIGGKAGVALGESGLPLAGMGIAVADCDGNGRLDLFVTNLAEQNNSLYRNVGLQFQDDSYASGLGAVSLLFLGFGANFFDADGDGDSDLAVANGHILDNVELYSDTITYEQTPFFFEALGGCRFRDVSAQVGDYFRKRDVGRGTAVGDLDNDGDPDLVISSSNRPAHLLWNESKTGAHRLSLRLVGERGRDALGARVDVKAAGVAQFDEVRSASSYLSQGEMALHFGLGSDAAAEAVVVVWPDGRHQDFGALAADRFYILREGSPAGKGIPAGKPRR